MKSRTLTCITAIMLFAALAVPVQLAAQVSGVGITNRIPIWTNSTTLGNSNLFQTGGKVGIGTTIPAATLDVKGANGTANVSGGNAPMTLQVTGGGGATSNFGFGVQGAGGSIKVMSGKGKSLPGTMAIGGTGAAILMTGGSGATCGPASVGCGANIGGNGGSVTLQPGGGGFPLGHNGNVLLSPSGGNVGIGVTSPTHALEIKVGGTTLADAWTTRSSRHYKANIQPLQGALEKVERLQGVSYERKSDAKREIGVIAEDVEEIVPEVVSRDSETHDVEGVDYSRLTALLIEAVKSQQAELRMQQSELQQLKARIEQLTSNSSGQ